ncbi:MAG: SOS response-associated peptidase [Bacteroidetes bacterium]|nr:SOS response-associated peptidase [Bacteroidota bacterium]
MCGRYSFAMVDELIEERFGVRVRTAIYKARYNCSPGQDLAVISNSSPEELSFFHWGLIPFWAKEKSVGYKMINAKSETITEKPSYKNAFRSRRCLIPADSFFEWTKDHDKVPYRILMKNEQPFAMAGIWDKWTSPDGEIIHSFSILTTSPNDLMNPIHDRMPVILSPRDEKRWLSPLPESELLDLLKPYPPEEMKAYKISRLVNSPKNDSAEVLIPVS